LTRQTVEKKVKKLQRAYMKRSKKHEGRLPEKKIFILFAAYSLFKEKHPERKIFFSYRLLKQWRLLEWLDKNFSEYKPFDCANLYKWMTGKPFKEMQYQENWDDLKTVYEISCNGASKGEMSQRDIQRKHGISKKDLEDFTGFILSFHAGNKKTSNKFIFDRPDK